MCEGEGKEYNSIESLDKDSIADLNNLEKILNYKQYIKGSIISIEDIEALENLESLNINIGISKYKNIKRWKKEIERIKLNWKISKKPAKEKGKTFKEYIQIQRRRLDIKNQEMNEEIKNNMKFHENILKPEQTEKEVATIHFFEKKNEISNYVLKILIKFCPDVNLTYQDLAPKILIICHNHFSNKINIEEYKDEKEKEKNNKCINIVITTLINTEDYNIEKLSDELRRNIIGITSINILNLEKDTKK